ncbi:PH domain-containing protein [Pseudonocardia sp. CA-107938]|uniref:PH domain-containing protein n=1 Tax=Pseudonocardia sp. CA-107938 TaxID=3240021 RepID=UPI003D93DCE4
MSLPSAETVPPARVRLRPPTHQVHPRAVTWWRLQDGAVYGVLLLAGVVALLFTQPVWLVLLVVALAVIAAVDTALLPRVRYARHRWEATDQAVYVRDGVLFEDWRVAPLSRVQTVDTQRGPLQQWLGLSTVTVTTASTAGSLKIHGLEKEAAAELVERLTAATEATPGDAT